MYGSSFDPRGGRGFGRIASGDFRACPCGSRGTSAPCCATRPAPGLSPGSNGPLLSARKSLSLVPPSAIGLMHLRRASADDAITIGRVNSNLLLLHILMLLVTADATPGRCLLRTASRRASLSGGQGPNSVGRGARDRESFLGYGQPNGPTLPSSYSENHITLDSMAGQIVTIVSLIRGLKFTLNSWTILKRAGRMGALCGVEARPWAKARAPTGAVLGRAGWGQRSPTAVRPGPLWQVCVCLRRRVHTGT